MGMPVVCADARVYSYKRFSDPRQASGSSSSRQDEYAARWAGENGMVLDPDLTMLDEGLSGYHQRHVTHGALGVFLRAVEDGHIPGGSVLIVESLDRLSRAEPLLAQAQLAQIINAGITVVTASDNRVYNRERLKAQPMDLVYSLLIMIRAHEESDTKSKRVKAAIRRQCEGWVAGRWRGIIRNGRDPHWVQPNESGDGFDLIPARAEAVKAAIQMYRDGLGARRVMQELHEAGLRLTHGGGHASHLYKLLRNIALVGDRQMNVDGTPFTLTGYYPALISPGDFASLQGLIGQRRTLRPPDRDDRIPGIVTGLGITYCGYCGRSMNGQNLLGRRRRADGLPHDGHRRIVCVGHSHNLGCPVSGSISCVPVERALLHYCADQMNLQRLLQPSGAGAQLVAALEAVRAERADAQARIERITDAIEAGEAPAALVRRLSALEAEAAEIDRRVTAAEHAVMQLSRDAPPADAEAWRRLTAGSEALEHDARVAMRSLVADTFDRIVIYHRGLAPPRVTSGKPRGGRMDIVLVSKAGTSRVLHIDRQTGDLQGSSDVDLSRGDLPLPPAA